MKIKFDSSQAYQIEAVNSIVSVFDGQPLNQGGFTIEISTASTTGQSSLFQTELGIGNHLVLAMEAVQKNVQRVQELSDLDVISQENFLQNGLNFSVEMETGTGKTYVYLRTIFELSQKYGFKKFIIVVPSVAIREGALKNIEITEEHFKVLFNNIPFEYFVYDSKKASRLRQFAKSNQIQVMVINIDAFRKDFTDNEEDDKENKDKKEKKSNVIFKENDKLSGRKPIEFVQATNPIVIIDEPQSVDNTPKAQEAIRSLNPLCTLRYSATHRNPYNLLYQLNPVKAYQLRLVKQIVVASTREGNAQNNAYVKLLKVDNKSGIKAKVRIHVEYKGKVQEKDFTIKQNTDLFTLSNEREAYRNGYEVTDISAEPGNEYIDFTSGGRLYLNKEIGGISEDLTSVQIQKTIEKHLEKELQVRDKGIKVLSLFFIDRVANYRTYDAEGKPHPGKFAEIFEQHYDSLIQKPRYRELASHPVERIHDGYFSQDKKGILKDTNGATQADDDTYAKIMRNKEQLLSLEEPLKFIFSHSALREGWDNPNVFQICTLNETQSSTRKRQEIGRGLRLPVNQQGERVFDENINRLIVIANENYDDFARSLQSEYEEDCGVTFGKVPKASFSKIIQLIGDQETALGREQSEKIWMELAANGFINEKGIIQPAFNPKEKGFSLGLTAAYKSVEEDVIAVLESYRLDRHIKKDEEPKRLILQKQVLLDPDFEILWNKIKHRTTYQVEYSTKDLVDNAAKAIEKMERIQPVKIIYREDLLNVENKGVTSANIRASDINLEYTGALPDIIAYLQKQTELTRKTLVNILVQSGRLADFLINPQKFMDEVASHINRELHKIMIAGIKYEKITDASDAEWSMRLFEEEEVLSYLNNRLDVKKSIYDAVVYQSDVERRFAEALEKREDVKLFIKLPGWFKIDTPIGTYNPDWAIIKHEDDTVYLIRETKGNLNPSKLRGYELDKVNCGRKHFEALEVDFEVVTSLDGI